jgi:protease-4
MKLHTLPAAAMAALALLAPTAGLAQGLADATTSADVPHSSSASASDGYAAYVNPAGLAFVDALQLTGGYIGRYGNNPRDVVLAGGALSITEGLTLGAGTGLVLQPVGFASPYFKNSVTLATRFDRFLAVGATGHALTDAVPGAPTRFVTDLGFQLRPWRWIALGGSLDNLGAVRPDLPSARAGVSIRPFLDQLTFSADLRASPGSDQVFTSRYWLGARLDPALTARLHIGGFAVTAGAFVGDALGVVPTFGGSVGIQLDTDHLGALLLGGGDTRGNVTAGVLGRASVERFASVWPAGGDWLTFTLAGAGGLYREPGDFIDELLNPPAHPIAVLTALERASKDARVDGVVLRLRGLSLSWGRMTELREAILSLREAGKMVVVHLGYGGDADVFLASAADRVILAPAGGLALDGLSTTTLHFKSLLDRFGVHADAIAAGKYKSGPNLWTESAPTEEELVVLNDLLDATWARLIEGVSDGRGIEADEVRAIVDRGGLTAKDALEAGIVDELAYWDEVPEKIEDLAGGRRPRLQSGYLDEVLRSERWAPPPQIAIIPIVGEIVSGRADPGLFGFGGNQVGADDVIDAIRRAKDDDEVAAVVLRVDSPGGDAFASDLIWHALMQLRKEKPVITSMGDTAASGGYYVAAATQEIFAEPETVTGSIGVYTVIFEGAELATDLGVHIQHLDRGARPPPNLLRPMNSDQRDAIQDSVDSFYERFLSVIVEGREMKREDVAAAAEGRVWTGAQALERGLVDKTGGLSDAIARARELAEIDESEEIELSILTSSDEIFPRIGTAVSALVGTKAEADEVRAALRAVLGDPAALRMLSLGGRPLALGPRITVE